MDAARIYKLKLERRARLAKDWLTSDEPVAATFLGDLTDEMRVASLMLTVERYRLVVAALGIDFESLYQMAEEKRE